MNTPTPVLQIRQKEEGDWFVAATWPDGKVEEISGFTSESEANGWVAKELQRWLDKRAEEERAKT